MKNSLHGRARRASPTGCVDSIQLAVKSLRWCLLFVLLIPVVAAWAVPPPGYSFLPYGKALVAARAQGRPLFIYLGRLGCSSCNKTNAETFSNRDIRERYTQHYVLAYIDTESGHRVTLPNGERITEMELANRMRIFGTPTFFYVSAHGKRVIKAPGFKTIADFEAYDDYVTGGFFATMSLNEYLATRP